MAFVSKNLSGKGVYYDNTGTDVTATNLQDAITELSFRGAGGFANIFWVKPNMTVTIEDYQENICTTPMIVQGVLIVDGRATIL